MLRCVVVWERFRGRLLIAVTWKSPRIIYYAQYIVLHIYISLVLYGAFAIVGSVNSTRHLLRRRRSSDTREQNVLVSAGRARGELLNVLSLSCARGFLVEMSMNDCTKLLFRYIKA